MNFLKKITKTSNSNENDENGIEKIVREKRDLLLGYKDKVFGNSDSNQGLIGKSLNFKINEDEQVEIIEFSDDGSRSKLETKLCKIKIGKEIGRGYYRTCYQLSIDGNDGYVIRISNLQPLSLNEILNETISYEIASIYSNEFNKMSPPKPITIIKPFLINFIQRSPNFIAQGEVLIKGESSLKSNSSHRNINDEIYKNTPKAFSHLTLVLSNNNQIITDIQGYDNIYTDLQIHSNIEDDKDIYGKGNLGNKGLLEFTESHKCNHICKLLKIDNNNNSKNNNYNYNSNSYKSNELFRMGIINLKCNNNFKMAMEYLKKSSDLGNSNSLGILGDIYMNGLDIMDQVGLLKDSKLGIQYFKKSSDKGNSNSMYKLGQYYQGIKDFKLAVEYLTKASELDNIQSVYELGLLHISNKNKLKDSLFKPNGILGIDYLKTACELGHIHAYFDLGILYQNGNGNEISPDINKAVEYFKISSEKGNPNAMNNLGTIYYEGDGRIKSDINISIEYFKKAAERGNANSMNNLGVIYFHGKYGTEKNIPLSMEYYKKSAQKGNINSLFNLGRIYENDEDDETTPIQPDIQLSIKYYLKAAEKDHTFSLFNLGRIYEKGKFSTEPDLNTALKYYKKAADLGYLKAKSKVSKLNVK